MAGSWLIVGCGYVGAQVAARLHAAGESLAVVTRDATRAGLFAQRYAARSFVGEYADAPALGRFCAGLPAPLRVLCLLPPSACEDGAGSLAPLRRFVALLDTLAPVRAVLTSSTGVYGEQGGAVVSAESPCRPQSAREQRLFEIEQCWQGPATRTVLRYAGLYGPGRVIGLAGLRRRAPVAGDPDGYLNLIHVADAAALLVQTATGPAAAIELGADGHPATRRQYYSTLAALAGAPAPVFDGAPPVRGGAARRCDPTSTCTRLAWRPMYRDFRAGLAALDELAPIRG